MPNQNPEQRARDQIDAQLRAAGWAIQSSSAIDLNEGQGQAVREYTTDCGPADYVFFVDRKAVGITEAKKNTLGQNITTVENQTGEYAAAKLKWIQDTGQPLPFLYEATGVLTRFTDQRDPKPRSREVFTFHRPETLREMLSHGRSLRDRLQDLPVLDPIDLRDCQVTAVTGLDKSVKKAKPRALVQMATGSGKTFAAITFIYRVLKHAKAKRILFLVDTRNLGEQAEQEFLAYTPSDDNRKFTELYTVQRLNSCHVPKDAQVCISTIQRMYSILQGRELDESAEEENPAEQTSSRKREPLPVTYNEKVPIEHFDLIIIDECHRSIYNLWRQVLDYFDAFLVGLTATPDARTYAFFNQNVVSEYTHEEAVADGVNVQGEIYLIETEVTRQGGTVLRGLVEKREKLTRAKRWEQQDEDEKYSATALDRDIVNKSQIRTIIQTFRDKLPEIFPDRSDAQGDFEVPKTLVFAKTDSHADDIIQLIREEFGESSAFCKKVTYKNDEEDPKSVLQQFRNEYHPRIAVTVDMIATGTDVKPLECLLFMRDVKSRGYFEQMKGRGTRTLDLDGMRKATPSAKTAKLTAPWRKQNPQLLESPDQLLARIQDEREERYEKRLKEWKTELNKWEKGGAGDKRPAKPRKQQAAQLPSANQLTHLPDFPPAWSWISVENCAVEISDGPFGSNLKSSDYVGSGVRVVRLENIGAGEFIEEKESFISHSKYENLKRHTVRTGDIVVASFINDAVRAALIPLSIAYAVNKADCFQVHCFGDSLAAEFLLRCLGSRYFFKQLEQLVHGVGRPRINTTQLGEAFIPLCTLPEQQEIVRLLDEQFTAIEQNEREIDAALKRSAALRQSILKKAFTGQLVLQDPSDEPASQLLERICAERETAAKAPKKKAEKKSDHEKRPDQFRDRQAEHPEQSLRPGGDRKGRRDSGDTV